MNIKNRVLTAALTAALLSTAALAQSPAPAVAAPAPNEVVYVPQLPSPSDLSSAATAQGMTVAKISQTSDAITVTYTTASGGSNVICYRPISAIEGGSAAPAPAAGTTSGPATTTTTVVYGEPGPYYYPYGYGYGYYPWGWAPVSVRLGFGFGGFRGGHWR